MLAAWIVIATIAAVGNAGVPMGCFFLSASLLASMNVPILLMGVILPFYAVIDAIETTLNVWRDSNAKRAGAGLSPCAGSTFFERLPGADCHEAYGPCGIRKGPAVLKAPVHNQSLQEAG